MRRVSIMCVFALVCGWIAPAAADTLELAKGERLTGRLTAFAGGVVHFRTTLAGNVIAPVDEVVRLVIDAPVLITMTDGSTVDGFAVINSEAVIIDAGGPAQKRIPLDGVRTIERSERKQNPEAASTRLSAETGVLWRAGDDNYADLFGRIRLSSAFDRYLFDADLFVERADPADFPRWINAGARLKLNPDRLWQPVIGFGFERDTDKALRGRTGLTMGVIRRFPHLDFETEAGLVAETRRWLNEPSDDDLSLRLALRYTRHLFENAELTGGLSVTPSLGNLSDLRAASHTSLVFPFAQRLHLKLDLLIDYENYPQIQDLPKWRTTIGASLLWDF